MQIMSLRDFEPKYPCCAVVVPDPIVAHLRIDRTKPFDPNDFEDPLAPADPDKLMPSGSDMAANVFLPMDPNALMAANLAF